MNVQGQKGGPKIRKIYDNIEKNSICIHEQNIVGLKEKLPGQRDTQSALTQAVAGEFL